MLQSNIPNLSVEERVSNGLNQNQIDEESNALFTGAKYIDLDAEAIIAYEQIRQMPREHLATVAIHSEAPQSVVFDVFNHIFIKEHQMPIGPNQFQQTRFAPDPDIGRLWLAASQRPLSPDELGEIQRLLAHEYVEHALMARGIPYPSSVTLRGRSSPTSSQTKALRYLYSL